MVRDLRHYKAVGSMFLFLVLLYEPRATRYVFFERVYTRLLTCSYYYITLPFEKHNCFNVVRREFARKRSNLGAIGLVRLGLHASRFIYLFVKIRLLLV